MDGSFEFEVVDLHAVIEVDFEALLGEVDQGLGLGAPSESLDGFLEIRESAVSFAL